MLTNKDCIVLLCVIITSTQVSSTKEPDGHCRGQCHEQDHGYGNEEGCGTYVQCQGQCNETVCHNNDWPCDEFDSYSHERHHPRQFGQPDRGGVCFYSRLPGFSGSSYFWELTRTFPYSKHPAAR